MMLQSNSPALAFIAYVLLILYYEWQCHFQWLLMVILRTLEKL